MSKIITTLIFSITIQASLVAMGPGASKTTDNLISRENEIIINEIANSRKYIEEERKKIVNDHTTIAKNHADLMSQVVNLTSQVNAINIKNRALEQLVCCIAKSSVAKEVYTDLEKSYDPCFQQLFKFYMDLPLLKSTEVRKDSDASTNSAPMSVSSKESVAPATPSTITQAKTIVQLEPKPTDTK